MYRQLEVLVHNLDAIAVLREDFLHESCVHTGAEWALQIVVVYDSNLGVGIPAHWTSADVDLAHALAIDVFGEVHLGDFRQRLAILRQQEVHLLLAATAAEGDGYRVVGWEITGAARANLNLDARGKVVLGLNLALNFRC